MLIYVICVPSFWLQYHFPLHKYASICLFIPGFMDTELFPVLAFAKKRYRNIKPPIFNMGVMD